MSVPWLLLLWRLCTFLPGGELKRFQALSTRSKDTGETPSKAVISSSIDQAARGHSARGNGRRHCVTIWIKASTRRDGSLPSLRLESALRPLCKYSMASESRLPSTGGRPATGLLEGSLAQAAACSDKGLSTAASSSSSARSTTVCSTSKRSGRTLLIQSWHTAGIGQLLSSRAMLDTEAFRTSTDSSAERLPTSSSSKKWAIAFSSNLVLPWRTGSSASKKPREALRTMGFSSVAARRKSDFRST
mmetsp:Transcript_34803/g.75884  ORF Transcript_34803/g.75884 Transcript_34803/m.75884 type:complete len:246 (-) Transcript_34803:1821-2558(-)